MKQLIIEWADTGRTHVKEFKTDEALIEYASIAKFLGAKVCYKMSFGWVWS